MSEKKLYIHITNLAPENQGAPAEVTVELEAGRPILIGRYTPDKTAFVDTTAFHAEGIVNPPDPPGRKTPVKKIGLDINSVSRSHGTFSRQAGEVLYQDHSRFGTEYHEQAGDGPRNLSNVAVKVKPGDVLYLGKHTPEIPFKYSIVVTRRKASRRPKE